MNVVTPESASSSETLFGGEKDYAAMYDMICAHSVAQIVRCAALFSFADHLAAGPATADAVARVEGLNVDATFRLMRACAAYGLGLLGDAAPGDPAHDDPRSLCAMAMAGHGHWASFRPVAGGTHPRPAGIAEHIQRVRIWACSRRWRSCARSDTLVLDASVCCVSSSGSSPAGGATALRREALDHEAFDSGRQGLRSTAGVVVVFGQ